MHAQVAFNCNLKMNPMVKPKWLCVKCGLQCFHMQRALIRVLKACRTSAESSLPSIVSPSLPKFSSTPLSRAQWGLSPLCKEPIDPNPDHLWKKNWGMPKAEFQGWGFLSCSGLWWSPPQPVKRFWESSACWGCARTRAAEGNRDVCCSGT